MENVKYPFWVLVCYLMNEYIKRNTSRIEYTLKFKTQKDLQQCYEKINTTLCRLLSNKTLVCGCVCVSFTLLTA